MSISSETNDGVFWLLGSLIVLTLSAVFFSILIDKKFSFQRQANYNQASLINDQNTIDDLKIHITELESRLAKAATRSDSEVRKLESCISEIASRNAQTEILRTRKADLTAAIPKIAEEFASCRAGNRENIWRNAVGERIEHLLLNTGQQFDRVIITKVTDSGLEISHAHGRARIDREKLSYALQDRFQWASTAEPPPKPDQRTPERKALDSSDMEPPSHNEAPLQDPALIITRARALVSTGRDAVSTLHRLHSEALSKSRGGKERSVPGSLRTWQEQSAILEVKLAAATAKLAQVTAELREVSPYDPLLQVPWNQ